jgi:NADPH:quinone reductase-like Zn-dependent oxidoreductase
MLETVPRQDCGGNIEQRSDKGSFTTCKPYISPSRGPEKLIDGDRPDPEAGPGEVVVRVRATAINRAHISLRQGRASTGGLPRIPALDIAGEVAYLGPEVEGWQAGGWSSSVR